MVQKSNKEVGWQPNQRVEMRQTRSRNQPDVATSRLAFMHAGLLQRKCDCGNHTTSGACGDCSKSKSSLQRKASNNIDSSGVPPIVQEVLRSTGQPLDAGTRAFMEQRFGHDFSNVRIHADAKATASARAVNALAYTVGSEVVFDARQYAPETLAGRKLLAHELTHTLQQAPSGPALMPASLHLNEPDDVHEREADRVATTIMSGGFESAKPSTSRSPSIQRSLRVDDPPTPPKDATESPHIIFQDALAKVTERIVTYVGDDLYMENWSIQKPKTIESFIRRAMNSKRLYRLRLGNADLGGRPVRGATWETQGTDVVITVNPAHTGESTWTIGELLLQQIASAVVQSDPEQTPSGSQTIGTMDEMLTARLPYGSKDSDTQDQIRKLQKATTVEVSGYLNRNYIGRLSGVQIGRVIGSASRADGVTLLEIIQGVEANMPYRLVERRDGDRVSVTYEYPNRAPAQSTAVSSRKTTFIPGADATAQPLLPGVAGQCNDQQKQVDANSCCTPEMLNEITAHLVTARAYTQRAINRLETETGTDCYLKQHFGAQSTPANKREIASRLRTVSGELYPSRHEWKCREAGSGKLGCVKRVYMVGRKRMTELVRGVTPRDDISIVMCVSATPSYIDWVSVLHEVVHRTGVVGEEKYEGGAGYPGSNALENADSYARLAEDLGAPTWTRCK